MVTIPLQRPVTDAVIATLRDGGLTVVDNHDTDLGLSKHVIVQPSPGRHGDDGTIGDPHQSGFHAYLLRSVGTTREQAEWVADRARVLMLAGFTADDTTVEFVELDVTGQADVDDSTDPALHYIVDRYRIWTTG